MKKLHLLIIVLFMNSAVFGTAFYVIEKPVQVIEMRVGEVAYEAGDATNDPNELWPYDIYLKITGPNNLSVEFEDPNTSLNWRYSFAPDSNQIGTHEVHVKAYDLTETGTTYPTKSHIRRYIVHSAKLPPIIRTGGCTIIENVTFIRNLNLIRTRRVMDPNTSRLK